MSNFGQTSSRCFDSPVNNSDITDDGPPTVSVRYFSTIDVCEQEGNGLTIDSSATKRDTSSNLLPEEREGCFEKLKDFDITSEVSFEESTAGKTFSYDGILSQIAGASDLVEIGSKKTGSEVVKIDEPNCNEHSALISSLKNMVVALSIKLKAKEVSTRESDVLQEMLAESESNHISLRHGLETLLQQILSSVQKNRETIVTLKSENDDLNA